MKVQAVIMPRSLDPTGTIITEEALQAMARNVMEKGTIPVTDTEGNTYESTVYDAKVTEKGLQVTMEIPEGLPADDLTLEEQTGPTSKPGPASPTCEETTR